MNDKQLMNRAADNIRVLAVSMVEKANSGHPGGAMIQMIPLGPDVTASSLILAT